MEEKDVRDGSYWEEVRERERGKERKGRKGREGQEMREREGEGKERMEGMGGEEFKVLSKLAFLLITVIV